MKHVRGGETQVADRPLEQGRVRLVTLLLVRRDDECERQTVPLQRLQQRGCVHVRDHRDWHLLLDVSKDCQYLWVCARAPIFMEHRIDAPVDVIRDPKGLEEVLNRLPVDFSEGEERIGPDILPKGVSPEIFGRPRVMVSLVLRDNFSQRVWELGRTPAQETAECVDRETAEAAQVALCNDQSSPGGWRFHQTARDVLKLIKSATARRGAPPCKR